MVVPLMREAIFLSYRENPFLALSIPFPLPISLILSFILLTFLCGTWLLQKRKKNISLSLIAFAILLGALSNFYDRIFMGFVIDYIHIKTPFFYFPILNISDMLISLGILLWLCYDFWDRKSPDMRSA